MSATALTGTAIAHAFAGDGSKATTPRVLQILGRKRTDATQMVSLDDFQLREVDAGDDACAAVADRRNVTPYCLDHNNRRMIFAETPPEIDLSDAPFYYQAQYETATRLIAIPYDQVHEIAARRPGRPADHVFIFSVGRCGSTLMSKMWSRLDDTESLSEPDIFSAINYQHGEGHLSEREAAQLLGTTMRLVNRSARAQKRLVIKFRAQCIGIADLMFRQYPAASFIFMYRNAIDCVDSYLRVFGALPLPEQVFRRAFPYAQPQPEKYQRLSRLGQPMLVWLVCAHSYLRLRQRGLPFVAIKYEALVQKPHDSAARLFAHCGISDALTEHACAAMTEDAQAGTRLARNADGKRTLTADDCEFIRAFFAERAGMEPDETLAGTLNAWP
jgi:Sulfotransferase family